MQNSVSEGVPYEDSTTPYSTEASSPVDNIGGFATDAPAFSYDEVFPALPQNMAQNNPSANKMRIGSSTVTQVFVIPCDERRKDLSERFGESESMRICTHIMQATGALIEISNSKDQSLTFLVTGKASAVLEARRRILTNFQMQGVITVDSIPKEHHRFLLGKNGQKLKDLEKNTLCTIKIPSISDPSNTITITGPKEGMEKALHEIKVTSDEQDKQAYERVSVPKKFHPFICGPHNTRINELIEKTKVRINVPPPSVNKDEITIAGEKEGVQLAKSTIIDIHTEMEKKCSQVSVEVPKCQHKYVIGVRGNTIAEILQTTGVSVEMPATDTLTDTITLRGPQDQLGRALSMVYEKANSVSTTTVNAPGWIHKYIIGRRGANIRKITQDLSKVHVEFTDNKIMIEGPPEEIDKAREELKKVVQECEATMTFDEMTVDRKLHKHVIGKSGSNVNRLKDEHGVVINIREEDGTTSSVIRIEGTHAGVACAKQELQDMVNKRENEREEELLIDHRFFPNIIGSKGERIKEIKEKFNQVQINFPNSSEKRDVVKVRGPKEDVDNCCKYLNTLVKDMSEDSYMIEVPIYKHFHKFIIGKEGLKIRKIRDETQTKIDLPSEGEKSEMIRITGKKENVERARERITKIQDEMANIVQEEITIPPKFYNSLIGAGGKLIHSISEDCGGVQIKFPNAESKSDKVTIRGPKEDVDRAKEQLEELKNEREAASFTAEVRAKPQHHKFLIGKNGMHIRKIREQTGARIAFPSDQDEDKETITIIGKKNQVELAKAELEKNIRDIANSTESEMTVPAKHHKHFVARRGAVINNISDECGGVTISFPRKESIESDKVTLKGPKDCIELAKKRIEEEVKELESMVTIECVIPQTHHRTVMGPKGSKVQQVTIDFTVQIKFPDREAPPISDDYQNNSEEGSTVVNGEYSPRSRDIIRITGKLKNCEEAKEALLQLVPITIEVPVAVDLHRSIIGKSGGAVRQLMGEYDVHIVLSPADQKLDCIQISGAPANVEKAKVALEERVRQLEKDREDRQLKSFQLSVTVDPEFHPKIIGRKGAVISKIRDDFGVLINLPKRGDPEEHIITITGYEDKAIAARDHILSIVNELKDRSKEEIQVDSRVHSRLIGQKGRVIRKLMDDYHVDIKFPRQGDPNPDLVVIMGAQENVLDAKEKILNMAEEYLMEVHEAEQLQSYHRVPASMQFSLGDDRGNADANAEGFIVRGGPWEQNSQRRPDTASIEEFPTFGGAPGVGEGPQLASWGPRR